ncbi:hypothetical protein SteCoe_23963 [Stentor coeruleus]|uniref:Uncharacterized protein n=1 Tax=Stentor coeruleus TaxID=5963 RepID=A0A1R2BIQ3_9CILI|nr:hypothetical protein SteCoe_23963 [Stentor coeruleus]
MKKNALKDLIGFKTTKAFGNPSLGLTAVCSPLRSNIGPCVAAPIPKRINAKRNSEKPRGTSEKTNIKSNNVTTNKAGSLRKITPLNKNTGNRIGSNRLKRTGKDTSPSEILRESNVQKIRDSFVMKGNVKENFLKDKSDEFIVQDSVFSEESFDYDEFKNSFVMTSNLLYGDCEDANEMGKKVGKKPGQKCYVNKII